MYGKARIPGPGRSYKGEGMFQSTVAPSAD